MNIKVVRASDFARKVEYLPEEVEKLDLIDIANRYGHADTGELISVLDADTDELLGTVGWNNQYREYRIGML